MNHIKAKYEKSKYFHKAHLTISVDGKPLDVILNELLPDNNLIGLVPTLMDSLEDKKERKLVWDRIESPQKQIVPVLMCADDTDLWCTVVVAEIEKTDNSVKWLRLGIDIGSSENLPDSIGTDVDWFDQVGPLEFEKSEYEEFVTDFKREIEKDEMKKLIQFWISRIENIEEIPICIKAFNFGLIECDEDFQVYLIGAKEYNTEDDEWACSDDFVPKEKYLSLGNNSKKWNWEQIQSIVKDSVEQFIETRISPLTFVHNAEYMTVGFDDGTLVKIEQKMHSRGDIGLVIETKKDNLKQESSFWSKLKNIWS